MRKILHILEENYKGYFLPNQRYEIIIVFSAAYEIKVTCPWSVVLSQYDRVKMFTIFMISVVLAISFKTSAYLVNPLLLFTFLLLFLFIVSVVLFVFKERFL